MYNKVLRREMLKKYHLWQYPQAVIHQLWQGSKVEPSYLIHHIHHYTWG